MRAPNRPLDLDDLRRPYGRRILSELDGLLEEVDEAYLHPSKRWEYVWALERSGPVRGRRVLDVGSGGSIFPVYLRTRGAKAVAVDYWRYPGLGSQVGAVPAYVKGDMLTLPFRPRTFHRIFCISVIEHLPAGRVEAALRELRRVLRPGGRILLTTDLAEDADEPMWYEGEGERFPVDWNVFDEARVRAELLDAPGLRPLGPVRLEVDWPRTRREMRAFHGYPYTSLGVALGREGAAPGGEGAPPTVGAVRGRERAVRRGDR